MRFVKMQGLGNDYLFLNCMEGMPGDLSRLAVRLSDRHFGVGSDGLICICPSRTADFGMRIWNADGSEAQMCGNGIRCAGKFVYDEKLTDKEVLSFETGAGIRTVWLKKTGGHITAATVDMGEPRLLPPLVLPIQERDREVWPVSMGNPHAVLFIKVLSALDLSDLGPRIEGDPAFPDRTNVEFVAVRDRTHLEMRVWERGSGETLACGTGACAALAAAVANGLTDRESAVALPGGELRIEWRISDNHIYMTGPAVKVFDGNWPEDLGKGSGQNGAYQ